MEPLASVLAEFRAIKKTDDQSGDTKRNSDDEFKNVTGQNVLEYESRIDDYEGCLGTFAECEEVWSEGNARTSSARSRRLSDVEREVDSAETFASDSRRSNTQREDRLDPRSRLIRVRENLRRDGSTS